MSVLEESKKHLTIIGIRVVLKGSLPQLLQNSRLTINRLQISVVTFLFGTWIISIVCTLVFEAKEFIEFSDSLSYLTTGCVHSSFYCISLWKRSPIMAFINDLEKTIERSI